jgi:hypothetical protein
MTIGKGQFALAADRPQCAGRAIMWANECKKSRDRSVPELPPDNVNVFANIREFIVHHKIVITAMQLMGLDL